MGPKDLGGVDWNPAPGRLDESPVALPLVFGTCGARGGGLGVSGSGPVDPVVNGDGAPQGPSPASAVQTPPSAPRIVPVPSSPSLSGQLPASGSSFVKNCAGRVAAADTHRNYENLTYDELHRLCSPWRH